MLMPALMRERQSILHPISNPARKVLVVKIIDEQLEHVHALPAGWMS
jgi:hypothetical protein